MKVCLHEPASLILVEHSFAVSQGRTRRRRAGAQRESEDRPGIVIKALCIAPQSFEWNKLVAASVSHFC